MANKIVETPLMKQYIEMKGKHPDAILLFRVGDFYETFSEDAIITAEILGITLTRRANGAAQYVELAGFPHHALDAYLPKLIRAGKRVAICEQLEDPKLTKKLVKRGITELVTPGVSINDNILQNKENNFLAALYLTRKGCGVSLLDISTGEFLTTEGDDKYIDKLLSSFAPKEILIERGKRTQFDARFEQQCQLVFELDDWVFTTEAATERLLKQFDTKNLKGFGVHNLKDAIVASGVILHYLDMTQHRQISHITTLSRIEEERYMRLDRFTLRSLELLNTISGEGRSLLSVIDKTISPMGGRLLRRWITFPLKDVNAINRRLDTVDSLFRDTDIKLKLVQQISLMGDLERLVSKIATGRVTPREISQLRVSLGAAEQVRELLMQTNEQPLKNLVELLDPCAELRDRIECEINPEAPALINRGNIISSGVNAELDELRTLSTNGKEYLLKIQMRESEATGIPSLKIGFNNVFGYYIEVRNTHKDKVPEGWIRRQTLTAAERYITEELKIYEEKILGAEAKILSIETNLFNQLVVSAAEYIDKIQYIAQIIANLDVLINFATVAKDNNYIRPILNNSLELNITEGRHPVIEQQLPIGEEYISNSVMLNSSNQQVIIITGPNMAGKSALLRQTALIVIMAQVGCFVPAARAEIGVVDKVFTRVGASDNISLGESTFMVEMNEAADIINNLSERSLVLFDELGRGTSTYDGISIAWAVVEHILQNKKGRAKTLFATHYHELNDMEAKYDGVVNYNVSVKEINNRVVFLRKLTRGGSEHSFGIHVAKMAGMPQTLVDRANKILSELEGRREKGAVEVAVPQHTEISAGVQLSLYQLDDPLLSDIRSEIIDTDINNLTPIEALNKLNEIKKLLLGGL